MDRRNAPAQVWGQTIGFWFRIWQTQIDQSLKIWALWNRSFPQPTAAKLSREAEAMRDITRTPETTRIGRISNRSDRASSERSPAPTLH